MDSGCILFFDSGIGGLTLMKECARKLRGKTFVYLGDNANAPYGNRTHEEIVQLTLSSFKRVLNYSVRAAIIACNTVTAECALALRAICPFPVIGVEPALKPAAKSCKNVLVLATRATLSSNKFRTLLQRVSNGCRFTCFCPHALAGEIEKNIADLSRIDLAVHLPEGEFDGAVLGCTHYIFLRNEISAALNCPVFDGNSGTADHLAEVLARQVEINTLPSAIDGKFFPSCGENILYDEYNNLIIFEGDSALKNRRVYCSCF